MHNLNTIDKVRAGMHVHFPLWLPALSACAGKAIKGNRSNYIIASKCGIVKTETGLTFDGSRKHVREACEAFFAAPGHRLH